MRACDLHKQLRLYRLLFRKGYLPGKFAPYALAIRRARRSLTLLKFPDGVVSHLKRIESINTASSEEGTLTRTIMGVPVFHKGSSPNSTCSLCVCCGREVKPAEILDSWTPSFTLHFKVLQPDSASLSQTQPVSYKFPKVVQTTAFSKCIMCSCCGTYLPKSILDVVSQWSDENCKFPLPPKA